ncbi:MAG: MBOAT family protein, partial [Verrucomicrobia bacterium]|nr:MBOAT family protein [Verrucomicrobiota bacterium]
YLYIPLGGNRGSKLFTSRNLLLTMLLGGLWHGASWTFVIWGGMHGVALIFHREWGRMLAGAGEFFKTVMAWLAVPLTFYWICLTWIFFRAAPMIDEKAGVIKATSLEMAWTIFKAFAFFGKHGGKSFGWSCFAVFIVLAIVHWVNSRKFFTPIWQRLPDWVAAALLGVGTELAILFIPVKYKAFIYFQF